MAQKVQKQLLFDTLMKISLSGFVFEENWGMTSPDYHDIIVLEQSCSQGLSSEERPWERGWFSKTSVFKMSSFHTKWKNRGFQIPPVRRAFTKKLCFRDGLVCRGR